MNRRSIMADNASQDSDGSNIDVDHEGMDDDFMGNNEQFYRFDFAKIDHGRDGLLDGFLASDSDDSGDEFEGFDTNWVQNNFITRLQRPYTQHAGPIEQHPEEAQHVHYFDAIWGSRMWQRLVTETIRYVDQERTRNPPPPHAPKWKPVDMPTMKAFIGLVFCMGILRLHARYDYWRQKKRMFCTHDRFNLIWRYLHLHNNEERLPRPVCVPVWAWFCALYVCNHHNYNIIQQITKTFSFNRFIFNNLSDIVICNLSANISSFVDIFWSIPVISKMTIT